MMGSFGRRGRSTGSRSRSGSLTSNVGSRAGGRKRTGANGRVTLCSVVLRTRVAGRDGQRDGPLGCGGACRAWRAGWRRRGSGCRVPPAFGRAAKLVFGRRPCYCAAADLVVVGSRRHSGFATLTFGSVFSFVADHASCPARSPLFTSVFVTQASRPSRVVGRR
ncbi:MAG: universal stress protein [Ilumatobacteraceae bacterium]